MKKDRTITIKLSEILDALDPEKGPWVAQPERGPEGGKVAEPQPNPWRIATRAIGTAFDPDPNPWSPASAWTKALFGAVSAVAVAGGGGVAAVMDDYCGNGRRPIPPRPVVLKAAVEFLRLSRLVAKGRVQEAYEEAALELADRAFKGYAE